MKKDTNLFNELYLLDMSGLPTDDRDTIRADRLNLHRHYSDANETYVLIGMLGALNNYLECYELNHRKIWKSIKKRVNKPVLLSSLIKEDL